MWNFAKLAGLFWIGSKLIKGNGSADEPAPSGDHTTSATAEGMTLFRVSPFRPLEKAEGGPSWDGSGYPVSNINLRPEYQAIVRALALAAGISTSELRVFAFSKNSKMTLEIRRYPGGGRDHRLYKFSTMLVPGFSDVVLAVPSAWTGKYLLESIQAAGLPALLKKAGVA